MPDIWNKLDDLIFEARWFIVLFLLGLSLIGGGLYLLSDRPSPSDSIFSTSLPTTQTSGVKEEIKTETSPININTATQEGLKSLPGIGPAIAKRIIDYRKTHGPFKKKENIMDVKGIGPKTFADLKDKITVD